MKIAKETKMEMSTLTDCNGFDSRCGFHNAHNSEEYEAKLNKLCKILMQEREVGEIFKGRLKLSEVLINTTIPQIFGEFISKTDMEACALGVIHLEGGGHRKSCKPDWDMIERNYDLYPEELNQRVPCPKCKMRSGLAGLIFHMNDVHEMTNKQIGKWLKGYGL